MPALDHIAFGKDASLSGRTMPQIGREGFVQKGFNLAAKLFQFVLGVLIDHRRNPIFMTAIVDALSKKRNA